MLLPQQITNDGIMDTELPELYWKVEIIKASDCSIRRFFAEERRPFSNQPSPLLQAVSSLGLPLWPESR
jgi:hypothetical protein